MHETGIVRDLVHRLERQARDAGALRVSGVEVWLGALCQFSAAHFRAHFNDEALGTAVQGADLRIVVSEDIEHPRAQSVLIQSVDLEVPDREA